MKAYVENGFAKNAVRKCNALYSFVIALKPKSSETFEFWVDLTENQKVGLGSLEKVDATFLLTDDDFVKMCNGKLNPQMAFIRRKMRIKGNMRKATVFTPDLFPKPTPENIEKYTKQVPRM